MWELPHVFLGREGAPPQPSLVVPSFSPLHWFFFGGAYPAAGMSRLPGGTSGSGVWPVGQWPGTWGPAGAQDGRRRGRPRGRGCRSARRLGAFGPLVLRRQREEGVYLGILGGRGCGGSTLTSCVTPRQHFPNCIPWEVSRVLLRQNPRPRRDQSLRLDEVAQDENGSRARWTPAQGASVGMSASRCTWGNLSLASPFFLGPGFL